MSPALPHPTAAERALGEAIERYAHRNPRSRERQERAAAFLPGGNTRTVLAAAPFPLTFVRGQGAHLWSLDGDEYVDFLGEFTAGLYGHSDPTIRKALEQALDAGIGFGGHNVYEAKLAELICGRFPSIARVRFTNSGTEANLLAMSTAVAVTGRRKILVFEGGYHGGVFVFAAGGSPLNAPFDFLLGRYNDAGSATDLIAQHAHDLAAVVIEPMLGSGGCIPASLEFLRLLRAETERSGALLIFDEVMTSRLAPGGLQSVQGVRPDLTTLGKYLGGGMSFGAFGGRDDLMARFNPYRPNSFMHAGTFNNNVLTMAAGIAGLSEVYTPDVVVEFNRRGDGLRERLNSIAQRHSVAMQFTGLGSMMALHFSAGTIRAPADSPGASVLRDLFFFDLLEAGVWIAKRGMINMSLPVGAAEQSQLEAAVEAFVTTRRGLLE